MSENERLYRVFTRSWWRPNRAWPSGLEPHAGKRRYKGHPQRVTYSEAQDYCRTWNANNPPGRYSYKAEFEER